MKTTIFVKFVGTDVSKEIQNVPTSCSISRLVQNLAKSYFPNADISLLRVVNSGKIINNSCFVGDLTADQNNQIRIFINGPLNKVEKIVKEQNEAKTQQSGNEQISKNEPHEIKDNKDEGKIEENIEYSEYIAQKYAKKERKVGLPNQSEIPQIPKNTVEFDFNDDPDEIIVVEKQEKPVTKKKKGSKNTFVYNRDKVFDPLRNPKKEKDEVSLSYFYKNEEISKYEKRLNSLTKLFILIILILSFIIGMECVINDRYAPIQLY